MSKMDDFDLRHSFDGKKIFIENRMGKATLWMNNEQLVFSVSLLQDSNEHDWHDLLVLGSLLDKIEIAIKLMRGDSSYDNIKELYKHYFKNR